MKSIKILNSQIENLNAEKVAAHLRSLGMEVKTGVHRSGRYFKGKKPGKYWPCVPIWTLPVTERNNLPFKSNIRANTTEKKQE